MKIVYNKPLIWPVLKLFFPEITWYRNPVTIADTIYTSRPLAPWILEHEKVHVRQQKSSKLYAYFYFIPRYIIQKSFRDRMEAEGYEEERLWKQKYKYSNLL